MELADFLAARLDEDEAAAKAAAEDYRPTWKPVWILASEAANLVDLDGMPLGGTHVRSTAGHIARHDPARVLRDVEAKRAILARYGEYSGTNIGEHLQWSQEQQGLYRAMCALAAVWSDHPDYQQEWKP